MYAVACQEMKHQAIINDLIPSVAAPPGFARGAAGAAVEGSSRPHVATARLFSVREIAAP